MESLERSILAKLGVPDPYRDTDVVNRTRSRSAMSDPEPPRSSGQPEHDRSFARLRNFLRLIRRPRNGESLRETIDEMIEEPAADDARPSERRTSGC